LLVKILDLLSRPSKGVCKAKGVMTAKSSVKLFLALLLLISPGKGFAAPAAATSRSEGLCNKVPHDNALYFGMSTSLSGPIRAVGYSMRAGVEAYFSAVNHTGGINGHPLCLDVLDDSYDPPTAAANTLKLSENPKILALIGNVGTPTAKVSLPIATSKKILFFGALTGSSLLRSSHPNRYVINFRASYADEVKAMINGLLGIGIKPYQIAVFAQNDAYGDTAYQATVESLKEHGDTKAAQTLRGNYPRSTVDVEDALIAFLNGPLPPKAFIMAGAYAPSAKFIRLARQIFRDPYFVNLSFVDGASLQKTLGPEADGIIITQVVPPVISDAAGDFHRALAAYNPKLAPNDISFEGYLAAKVFVEGLKRAGKNPSRESIIDALLSLKNLDIGIGLPISFDENNLQASHKIWPVVFRDGAFNAFEWESVAKSPN
jgi:branched-chain amino acid transport system substrate-binding protein